MLRMIAKLWAYRRAPAATFVALHPVRTAKLLGSSFVALPVGIWIGRKLNRADGRVRRVDRR